MNTVAIAFGALLALSLRRPETGVAGGLVFIAVGEFVLAAIPVTPAVAVGALVHGCGHGLFWVGVQAALGRRAGEQGSERSFAGQYALYITGSVCGAAVTGLTIALLRGWGLGDTSSIRLSFLIGTFAALVALPSVLGWLRHTPAANVSRPRPTLLGGLALQIPALFLVGSMGMLLSLAPVVLSDVFRLRPLVIGLVSGAIALAKIGGSLTAGRIAPTAGARASVGAMLAASALSVALLVGTSRAWVYVALTLSATFFGIGVWPILVDGALARVRPDQRPGVTIAWNVREYTAIATTTVVGGYLLHAAASPNILLVFAAALLVAGSLSALVVFRSGTFVLEPSAGPQGRAGC